MNAIKTSQTITIERVSNGWIVRPYPDFRRDYGTTCPPEETYCFTNVRDLCDNLPVLLGVEPPQVKRDCLNVADCEKCCVDNSGPSVK